MKKPVRTTDAIYSYRGDSDAIVAAGEMVEMRFPSGSYMSLRAGKLFHLLVQVAGVNIHEDRAQKVTLAWLNETFHVAIPELIELVDELHTTTLKIKLTDADGRRFTKSGPILSDVEREDSEQAQAEIRFQFSPALRKAIENSSHWAVLSRRAILSFESKYALRLYDFLALRSNLWKTSETFSLDDIREILGVPNGKLTRWQDLKTWTLEPAVAEIGQLGTFYASYNAIKRGRRVIGVELTWGRKDPEAIKETIKELDRPKVGRKARRYGTVDTISETEGFERQRLSAALSDARMFQEDDVTDAN